MKILDTLRGLYVKSPNWLKRSTSPLLAMLPIQLKYGKTYLKYYNDIQKSKTDAEFVREYQLSHLKNIIKLASEKSIYYKEILKEINPDTFSFEDLAKIPILDKETVRSSAEELLTIDKSKADTASTSGTSGKPLKFYLDKSRSVKEWAFVNSIWEQIGYNHKHLRASLRGVKLSNPDKKPYDYNPALNELRLSPFHMYPHVMDKYLELITKYKVDFIHGYPSGVDILAKYAKKTVWKKPKSLKGVFVVSETMFDHQRVLIEEIFGKVASFYGMSEKVGIAGEIEPDLYEFEPLYAFVELIDDDGKPVTEKGKIGRIVGTGFISTVMPFIRYDTADYAELVELPTAENFYRLKLRNIKSRWGQEFVVDNNNGLISISAINIHSPVYAKIREFQIYQDTIGKAIVKVVKLPEVSEAELQIFVDEIQEKVGKNIEFSLELCEELPKNTRGKRKFIDQKLDLEEL